MQTTYLTQDELAERWRISPNTLASWRSRGTGPKFIRIGDKPRYRLSDVEDYESERHNAR